MLVLQQKHIFFGFFHSILTYCLTYLYHLEGLGQIALELFLVGLFLITLYILWCRLGQLRDSVQGALARARRRQDAQREDTHSSAAAGIQK